MKHTLLVAGLMFLGCCGSLVWDPFLGVAVYYLFAVLRPQALWQWALPPGVAWSFYIAIATLIGTALHLTRIAGERRELRFESASNWAGWSAALFTACIAASTVQALNFDVAWDQFNEYGKILLMMFVALVVIRRFSQVRLVYSICLVALVYIAYEMNSRYLFQRYLMIVRRGFGGLDNNGAALMMAMAVPLCYFAFEGERRWFRWLYLIAIPPVLHCVLMSFSRGAMLSTLLYSPLLIARSRNKAFLLTTGMLFAVFGLPMLAGQQIRERFYSIQEYSEDASANSRFDSWKAAIKIAADYPILGVGPRNSNLLSYSYGADREGRTIHSQYLQIMADCGYISLVFYLLMVWFSWRSVCAARRKLKGRKDPPALQAVGIANGLEGSFAIFAIGGLFLSLEIFELPYVILALAMKLPCVVDQLAPPAAHEPLPGTEAAGEFDLPPQPPADGFEPAGVSPVMAR